MVDQGRHAGLLASHGRSRGSPRSPGCISNMPNRPVPLVRMQTDFQGSAWSGTVLAMHRFGSPRTRPNRLR
ncbi:hypothetical protein CLOP_g24645 [Closterium sp. NIES-67]|nr:hypothetical protein CLOP_g24645 [Closterium sp. NIES-67]